MLLVTQEQFQTYLFLGKDGSYYSKYDGYLLQSVFQPIFNTQQTIIGYEALLRIYDNKMLPIRPDLFFKDATRTVEQILNIERLSRIIHIRNFSLFSQRNIQLFLNILPESAVHFHINKIPTLNTSLLESRIQELGLSPQYVTLELLEFHYHDKDKLLSAIEDIKSHGFNIAIDDFGSEASSEERVSLLEPNILKIDRSLLLQYENGNTTPILSAIALARKQKALIVIEGVETAKQYEDMKSLGIDYFQGFLLGKPLPLQQQNHQAA
ncbi:EAL domain-containing protein [Aliivibrio sifiae]|jgi:EAL domain-containing protein (putative c-di-GMP-specific phosphodiesterase class I)|uniref:Diguanylate phosphodiesterase n=1 Tax=Aliivibrio sifiae TaxID=566293 RepID=A0A2S7X391_9GAMM|nr:EAL domain-containing protein [Aliivibrio sifiae]PQJ84642.1 diguanylate phosphodiesterase [Aliivibrio sifiae]